MTTPEYSDDPAGHCRTAGEAVPVKSGIEQYNHDKVPWFSAPSLFIIFGLLYFWTLNSNGMLIWDEAEYACIARSLLNGEGFQIGEKPNSYRLPVVPLCSMLSQALFGSTSDFAAKIPTPLFAVMGMLIVYLLVKTVSTEFSAICSALFLGMFPDYWTSTSFLLTEIPFMAFNFAAVAFLYLGSFRDARWYYACWLFWGLSASTRFNAVLFGPTAVILIAVYFVFSKPARRLILSKHFFLSPLVAVALVGPWLIRQQLVYGDALVAYRYAAIQVPNYNIAVMPWYFYTTGLPSMISWLLTPILIAGIGYAVYRKDGFQLTLLFSSAFAFGWMHQYEYKELRLISAILPTLAVVAGIAIEKVFLPLLSKLEDRQSAMDWILIGLGIIFCLNFYQSYSTMSNRVALGYPSLTNAMSWIQDNSDVDDVLLGTPVAQMSWYANRPVKVLPDSREDLEAELTNADWVVIANFERGQPELYEDLLREITSLEESEAVHSFRAGPYLTVVIEADYLAHHLDRVAQPDKLD